MRPKVVAALWKYDADDQIFLRFQCYWKRASKIGYKCSGMERESYLNCPLNMVNLEPQTPEKYQIAISQKLARLGTALRPKQNKKTVAGLPYRPD